MTGATTVALLGGPESGKSTYLGALVDALQSGRSPGFLLGDPPDDTTAYDRLTEPLLEGRYPQRTKAERHVLDLLLRTTSGGLREDVHLNVGDYDGEEVERLFDKRTQGWTPEWQGRAHARGVLLFLRPNALAPLPRLKLPEPPTEPQRWESIGAAGTTASAPGSDGKLKRPVSPERVFGPGLTDEGANAPIAAPRDPVQVPTELAVVELLQFLRHVRGLDPGERPRPGEMRIVLLASAWDAVDPAWQRTGPASFFAQRAPLLEDFLWSNFHPDDVFRFGLSSTAGDLRDVRHSERYAEDPHGFVHWADTAGRIVTSNNLVLPVAWSLFGECSLATEGELIPQ